MKRGKNTLKMEGDNGGLFSGISGEKRDERNEE
jgi:hypothetical protein